MSEPHRLQHQLSAYLDGELSPEEMADVRRHLAGCEACAAELEGLRFTKRLLGRLESPTLPRDFAAGLWARIDRPERRRWTWWPRPAMALAAVVLALILVGVPLVRGHLDRLKAAEVGPDLFIRSYVPAAAADPFIDRAFLGLVTTDAGLRLVGHDPRGGNR